MGALIMINSVSIDTRNANERRMKPVEQIDKNGNIIAVFPSIAQAQRETGILHIYDCLSQNNNRNTAGGYFWRLQGEF